MGGSGERGVGGRGELWGECETSWHKGVRDGGKCCKLYDREMQYIGEHRDMGRYIRYTGFVYSYSLFPHVIGSTYIVLAI